VDGYTKKNWKCQSNINIGFSLTLSATSTAQVLTNIDLLVAWLLSAMGMDSTHVDAITFTSIALGSVVASGNGTTSSGSAASTTAATSSVAVAASTSGSVGGAFTITSSSVVTNGVTTHTEDTESSNTGLIVGLAVGIPVAISIYFPI